MHPRCWVAFAAPSAGLPRAGVECHDRFEQHVAAEPVDPLAGEAGQHDPREHQREPPGAWAGTARLFSDSLSGRRFRTSSSSPSSASKGFTRHSERIVPRSLTPCSAAALSGCALRLVVQPRQRQGSQPRSCLCLMGPAASRGATPVPWANREGALLGACCAACSRASRSSAVFGSLATVDRAKSRRRWRRCGSASRMRAGGSRGEAGTDDDDAPDRGELITSAMAT
jgi:hypothetical protein